MGQKVILKKSNVEGKIPSANTMDFGEVYVNYASGNCNAFLATKKYDGTVAQFMERQHTDKVSMLAYKTKSDDLAGIWNVDIPGVTEYYDGLSVNVRLETTYNTTYNVLNINGLGYKYVFWRRNARLTSHYARYSELRLTYRTDASSGVTAAFSLDGIVNGLVYADGFVIENVYYSDSNDTYSLRDLYARYYVGPERVSRYQILGLNRDNQLVPLTVCSAGTNATSTTRTLTTQKIKPDTFFYYGTTTNVASGSAIAGDYLYRAGAITYVRYTFPTAFPAYNRVFLRGTYDSSEDLFELYDDINNFFTFVPAGQTPNLDLSGYFVDGEDYIFFGETSSGANMFYLTLEHPLYHFDGTNLLRHEYHTIIEDELVTAIALNDVNSRINSISGSMVTPEQAAEYAGSALANAIVYIENVSGNIHTALTDDEYVISSALADLDSRMASMSTTTISLIHDELLSISATIDTVVNESIEEMYEDLEALSGNIITELIKDEYAIATSLTDLDSRIGEISGNVTDIQFDMEDYITSADVCSTITSIESTLESFSGSIISDLESFSGSIISEMIDNEYVTAAALNDIDERLYNYATSADVYNAISAGGGGGDISGYATSANVYETLSRYATSASTHEAINGVNSKFGDYANSANVYTTLGKYATSANTHAAINDVKNSLTNVYKYKGSKTNYSDLPQSNNVVGDVWNVVNANGNVPAGTNYAWDGSAWDALGGTVDLSNYVQTSTLSNYSTKAEASEYAAAALANAMDYTDTSLSTYATSANVYTTLTKYATSANVHSTIGNYATSANVHSTIGKYATSANVYTTLGKYATSANTHTTIGTVSGNIRNAITAHTSDTSIHFTVSDWAKAANKPTYTASEVGALPTGTTLDNISDGSTRKLSNYATSANVYTTFTKYATSANTHTTIGTVSGNIRNAITAHTASTTMHLPTVTSSDNGKILQVVNGAWALVTPVSIFSGSTAPDNLLGIDGDIYLQI